MFEQDTNSNDESPLQLAYDAQQVVSVQPQPTVSGSEWGELLIKLLATVPEDVAHRLVSCLDSNLIVQLLEERRNDPYLKAALLLLSHKK